jgi:hypothetical protein
MRSIRKSVRYQRDGGALLIFPSGLVDSDPVLLPGAREALATWWPAIGALLRSQQVDLQRRKLAETLQVIRMTIHSVARRTLPRARDAKMPKTQKTVKMENAMRVLARNWAVYSDVIST